METSSPRMTSAMASGAYARCPANWPHFASASRVGRFFTTIKSHGCEFLADPVQRPASRMSSRTSSGIARSENRRTERSDLISSDSRTGQVYAHRRHVVRDQLAHPPVTRLTTLAPRAEPVAVETGAHKGRWRVREWITPQQLQRGAVVLEQLGKERDEPRMLLRRGHRRKPHQPVEAQMIRRHLRRDAARIARLPFEFVLCPLHRRRQGGGARALDDDLAVDGRDGPAGAV